MSISPTRVERAIAAVSPSWAHKRMVARLRYEAAQSTRFRDRAPAVAGSESTREAYDRVQLIAEARDLEQNMAVFRHLLDLYALYTLPSLTYQPRTGDRVLDAQIVAEWQRWCRDCDLSGRWDLLLLLRTAIRSRKRDGDIGLLLVDRPEGLRLTLVEADRIGQPYNEGSGNDYISGVTIDEATGRPLSYRVYERTRSGAYVNPQDVAADQLCLFMLPVRADQYRGRSDFASFLTTARDYKEVMDSLRVGIKFETMHGGVIHTDTPDLDPTSEWAGGGAPSAPGGAPVERLEPGRLVRVATTEKVDFLSNSRPSTAFQGYMTMLLEEMAAGANIPPGFAWPTLFGKGPGVRMEAQMALRTFQSEQQLLIAQFLDRAKNRVIMRGILEGRIAATPLPLPGSDIDPYYGRWSFGRWVTIDAGRDSRAMIEEYRAGIRTLASIADEQGDDWEDVVEENVRIKRRIRELADEAAVPYLDQQMLTPGGQIPTDQPAAEGTAAGGDNA